MRAFVLIAVPLRGAVIGTTVHPSAARSSFSWAISGASGVTMVSSMTSSSFPREWTSATFTPAER